MNTQTAALRTAAIVFALIAVGHLWRVLTSTPMLLGNYSVPVWSSVLVIVIAGSLSIWLWNASTGRSEER